MTAAPPLAITFLGTRDGARSPRTNTSSQLVVRADGGLLVDAGLGATRQLLLAGGRPADLEGLLLTHWHPDHVGGLVPLLRRRWTARAPRCRVRPGAAAGARTAGAPRHRSHARAPGQAVELAGFTCTPFATLHGPPSCGWLLEDADGRRVVIAGDTRPIPEVVEAVRGVDVLVYEATFAAHHAERALKSGHSTATEAGLLAARAGVGALVLTHLSSRYPRSAVREEAAAEHPRVLVPNDLDRLLVEPVAPRRADGRRLGGGAARGCRWSRSLGSAAWSTSATGSRRPWRRWAARSASASTRASRCRTTARAGSRRRGPGGRGRSSATASASWRRSPGSRRPSSRRSRSSRRSAATGSPRWRPSRSRPREHGLLVVADAKRGDIGSTAQAYAEAWLLPRGAGSCRSPTR